MFVCQSALVTEAGWEQRVAGAWASFEQYSEAEFVALIDRLAAELPPGSPRAAFERACAFDSTGQADRAVPLYRQALAQGLDAAHRRRAVIQLASSLRNLGQPHDSVQATLKVTITADTLDGLTNTIHTVADRRTNPPQPGATHATNAADAPRQAVSHVLRAPNMSQREPSCPG